MNASKPYILFVVVLLIVGVIYFIDSNSVKRGGSGESVTIVPRISSGEDKTKR